MTVSRTGLLGGAAAVALVGFAPGLVAAQETTTTARTVEAVVVTARKTEENIQDVPIAVTALSAEQLQRAQIDDVTDVAAYTPGFTFETFSGPLTQPAIRGQTQLRLTSPTQNVATFFNGVYLQRNYMVDSTLIDMQRVEIIKGPQSALYGRNAFSGAINLESKKPGDEFEAMLRGTIGSEERFDLMGTVSVPIIPGKLAALFSGATSEFDGTWTNNHPQANAGGLISNGKLGGWDKEAYIGRVVFTPIDTLEIDAFYTYSSRLLEQNPGYSIGTRANALGPTPPLSTFNTSPFNTLSCGPVPNFANVGGVFTPVAGSDQNRFWCGELPTTTSLAAGEPRLPGVVMDPRSFGLRGDTELFSVKANWDVTDAISIAYQYGRSEASIEAQGAAQRDPLNVGIPFGAFSGPLAFLGANNIITGTFFDSSGNGSSFEGDSHEIRITFDNGGRWRGFIGASYAETTDLDTGTTNAIPPNSTVFPVNAPVPTPGTVLAPGFNGTFVTVPGVSFSSRTSALLREEENTSVFAFLSFDVTDNLILTAEGRWLQEDQELRDLFTCDILPGAPAIPPTTQAPLACSEFTGALAAFRGPISANPWTQTRSSDYFVPRVSFTWNWAEQRSIYGSIAKGVKSGGLNGKTPFVGQRGWEAEENWTYELGSKNILFDGRLRLNGNIFYTEWENLQNNAVRLGADGTLPTTFAILLTVVGNIGGVEVRGAEVDGEWLITDNLSVNFGLAYNDASYIDSAVSDRVRLARVCNGTVCPANGAIGGNQLERTAPWDGVVGVNYERPLFDTVDFYSRLDLTYQSKMYVDETNVTFAPERALLNGSFGLRGDSFDLQIWGKNLLDEEYVASSLWLVGTGGVGSSQYATFLGEKRTIGATLTLRR